MEGEDSVKVWYLFIAIAVLVITTMVAVEDKLSDYNLQLDMLNYQLGQVQAQVYEQEQWIEKNSWVSRNSWVDRVDVLYPDGVAVVE